MGHAYIEAQQQSPARVSDGGDVKLRGTRDGAALGIPWLQALALEGRMFGVSYGSTQPSIVTVATFSTEAAVDLDEFDLLQTIPESVAVIPTYYKVGYVAIGTIAALQTILVYGNSGVINAGTTATTPYNFRASSGNRSACTVDILGDNVGTAITIDGVIFHEAVTAITGEAGDAAPMGMHEWTAATASYLPVLDGATGTGRQVAGFAHGEGSTGFLTYAWAELPIHAIE